MIDPTDDWSDTFNEPGNAIVRWVAWVTWGLIILGLALTALCLIVSAPAHATTWFNSVPNTLVNGTTGLSAKVNQDYNQIITDGNAANVNLLAQIAALNPTGFPAGAVVMFNSGCPAGFVRTDGTQNSLDTRGTFIRGLDNGAGVDPSRALASFQADEIQNHFHSPSSFLTAPSISVAHGPGVNAQAVLPPVATPPVPFVTSAMISPLGITETRPANIVLRNCISGVAGTTSAPFSAPLQILSNIVVPDANIMMADYNNIITQGNAAFNALQAAITTAGGSAFAPPPSGAVVPFNLAVCPTGWVPANGLPPLAPTTVDMRGHFARVTTGSPAVGTIQDDQFLDHIHEVVGSYVIGSSNPRVYPTVPGSDNLIITSTPPMSITDVVQSVTPGDGGANVGTETRPKNVALLYCQKT